MTPDAAMTPEELVTATAEQLGGVGAVYYFDPLTLATGKELGLRAMEFYVIGRGGVLGDVEPKVVQSAFGFFSGPVIATSWESARASIAPRDAARAQLACSAEIGRRLFADLEGLEVFCEAAETAIDAADPAGLALFAGFAAEPRPDDVPARALHDVIVLRELRGSVHLAALLASGIQPRLAHQMRRPDMVAAFGWEGELEVDDAAASRLDAAEQLTDRMMAEYYRCLSGAQATALATGAGAMAAAVAVAAG